MSKFSLFWAVQVPWRRLHQQIWHRNLQWQVRFERKPSVDDLWIERIYSVEAVDVTDGCRSCDRLWAPAKKASAGLLITSHDCSLTVSMTHLKMNIDFWPEESGNLWIFLNKKHHLRGARCCDSSVSWNHLFIKEYLRLCRKLVYQKKWRVLSFRLCPEIQKSVCWGKHDVEESFCRYNLFTLPCVVTPVFTRSREMQFALFRRPLNVFSRTNIPQAARTEVKLKIDVRPLKHTPTVQQGGEGPLCLGWCPSISALSGENVSPSSPESPFFCFSTQVTPDSQRKDKKKKSSCACP